VLFPAIKNIYPALASQFVLLMLATSVVSSIGATDCSTKLPSSTRALPLVRDLRLDHPVLSLLTVAFRGLFSAIYWAIFVRRPAHDPRLRLPDSSTCSTPAWTLLLAVVATVGGGLLGSLSPWRGWSHQADQLAAIGYINLIQGTPLLGQLFVFFFALPCSGCR